MKNFVSTMAPLCDFYFADSLHVVDKTPRYLKDKRFKPPFRTWQMPSVITDGFNSFPDGQGQPFDRCKVNNQLVMESVLHLRDIINVQSEPFDGFAVYSQGYNVMTALYDVERHFKKKLGLKHRLPFFVIDFNSGRYEAQTYLFMDQKFVSRCEFLPGKESLHFISEADAWTSYQQSSVMFSFMFENPFAIFSCNPVEVEHD